jgi:hypothetical protein
MQNVEGSNPFSTIRNLDVGGHEKSAPSRVQPEDQPFILPSSPLDEQPDAKMMCNSLSSFSGRGTDIRILWRSLTGRAPDC